ncbi:MAG: hypothetical protein JW827_10890 [Spirochaetes bacterium]|nr:hypothetical protein [Spirochaetota bacterium]
MALFKRKKKIKDILNRKLINLTFLNIFLVLSGLLWIDYLGLINIKKSLYPTLSKIPPFGYLVPRRTEDPYLLNREERRKQEIAQKIEWEKIKGLEEKLKEKESQLLEKEQSLVELEKSLKNRETELDKKYKDKENYKDKISLQAKYITSMVPKEAVKRLEQMDDRLVIDIFRQIESDAQAEGKQSLVPYLLSLMDAEKAAVIQRKMTVVEEDIEEGGE